MKKTKHNIANKDKVKNHELIHHSTAPRMEGNVKSTRTRSPGKVDQISRPRKKKK